MSGTKIKICGLFRPQDAESVNAALPDYAGFVFAQGSKRQISPKDARALRGLIDPAVKTVGVFIHAPAELAAELFRKGTISAAQLHGGEDEACIQELRSMAPGLEIWSAHRIRSKEDLAKAAASPADRILLDNGKGTGEAFDWSILDGFSRPFILAGGLNPKNIPEAIERFHPYAVDLSSGVETAGVKDGEKILAAVKAARGTK